MRSPADTGEPAAHTVIAFRCLLSLFREVDVEVDDFNVFVSLAACGAHGALLVRVRYTALSALKLGAITSHPHDDPASHQLFHCMSWHAQQLHQPQIASRYHKSPYDDCRNKQKVGDSDCVRRCSMWLCGGLCMCAETAAICWPCVGVGTSSGAFVSVCATEVGFGLESQPG